MDLSRLLPGLLPGRLRRRRAPRVALLRLEGAIGAAARPGARGLSDAALAPLIERAFRKGAFEAVALAVNSPGGSPVQSALIAARIRRLAEARGLPVHAFVEDVAASGGYWLACAADDIWADPTSVVGSIGVISAGFGLEGFISRHGIERRVHTAGGSKSFLDPFRPERPEDIARLDRLLTDMHESFKDWVRTRRGAKLAQDDLFTGEIWTGRQALATGLIDGLGHAEEKLRSLYGEKVKIVPIAARKPFLPRFGLRLGTALERDIGSEFAHGLVSAAEERALWARLGL